MKRFAKFQMTLAGMMMFLNAACATQPLLFSVGEPELEVEKTAWAELTADEKDGLGNVSCVTHLYRCEFNAEGQVTALKPLDLSHAQFQELSELSLRNWKFKPGKAGQCFVDFIYTGDAPTRMIILRKDLAEKVAVTRVQERTPRPRLKKKTESIKQVSPKYPKDAIFKGQIGIVKLRLDVNAEGIPENIEVIQSQPKGKFDHAARIALQQWRYKPLSEEPDTDRSDVEVSFTFNIVGSLSYSCPLGY